MTSSSTNPMQEMMMDEFFKSESESNGMSKLTSLNAERSKPHASKAEKTLLTSLITKELLRMDGGGVRMNVNRCVWDVDAAYAQP